jgi:uncharacterized membrane protein
MKIFGHPVHVMLIHFPSALFPMDFICSLVGYYTGNPSFVMAAFYALIGGVGMGWLAIITGVFDLAKLAEEKNTAVKKALIHAGVNLVVLTGFSLLAYMAWQQYPHLETDTPGELTTKGILVAVMIVGNFIGGSLVLKDRVGSINN